jgi:hypothetical protein
MIQDILIAIGGGITSATLLFCADVYFTKRAASDLGDRMFSQRQALDEIRSKLDSTQLHIARVERKLTEHEQTIVKLGLHNHEYDL